MTRFHTHSQKDKCCMESALENITSHTKLRKIIFGVSSRKVFIIWTVSTRTSGTILCDQIVKPFLRCYWGLHFRTPSFSTGRTEDRRSGNIASNRSSNLVQQVQHGVRKCTKTQRRGFGCRNGHKQPVKCIHTHTGAHAHGGQQKLLLPALHHLSLCLCFTAMPKQGPSRASVKLAAFVGLCLLVHVCLGLSERLV